MSISYEFRYPEAFIQKVKAEFPEDQELHTLMSKGSKFSIGKTLQDRKSNLYQEWELLMQHKTKSDPVSAGMISI